MKCHRIRHRLHHVCDEIELYSDSNSDKELKLYINNCKFLIALFDIIAGFCQQLFFGLLDLSLLTTIIKVDIKFIFWDNFFVEIIIIGQCKLILVLKFMAHNL